MDDQIYQPQQWTTFEPVKQEKTDFDGGYQPPPDAAAYDPNFYYPPTGVPSTNPLMQGGPLDEHLKQDKEAIYAHPLYPLLTCLFEKCELATCTPREQNRDGGAPNDVCSSASFKEDLADFSNMVLKDKPYYVPNRELDTLMLQAIQMLRFHLLELEKVHELCDNFCNRYVTCLKSKMPMDIVGEERASSSQPPLSPSAIQQSPMSSAPMSNHFQPPFEPQTVPLPESTNAMPHPMEGSSMYPMGEPHPLSMAGGPSAGLTPNGHSLAQPSAAMSASPSASSIADSAQNGHSHMPGSLESVSEVGDDAFSMCGSNDDGRDSVTSDGQGGKKKVPKVFSKDAINKFRAWLFQNLQHPYPSEEQKKQLANDTGLTILQVNNWFINARRRIVQPMIDQSNRAGRQQAVNVFKNRRRKDRESPSPDPLSVGSAPAYSPDAAAAAAAAMPMGYGNPTDLYNMQRNMFPAYNAFPNTGIQPFMPPMMMGFPPAAPTLGGQWMDSLMPTPHME